LDIVFEITERTKSKARKRRVRNERKWLWLRIVSFIAFPLSAYAFIKGIFFVDFEDYDRDLKYSIIFSVALIIGVFARALILGFTSRWIQDRFNEAIWVKNGKLYHFLQKSVGGGLNSWRTDWSGWLFISDLASITNARYDKKSGRIEFNSQGEYRLYSDYTEEKIQKAGPITDDYTFIVYDYTNPSFYEYLKSAGVKFKEERIDFKLNDSRV
jgi:hypothetical protein